jgi:uncharacterized protein YecT (DUF1311 family)
MNKMRSTIIVTLVTAFIAGCAKEPPKCSDEDTVSLVRQIIVGKFGLLKGVSDKELQDNMKIDLPRASAFEEKIKKYSCEAKLIAGGTFELPITYESQLDDKNQHVVSVGGIAIGNLLALQYAIAEAIQKGRAAKDGSASPSTGSTPQAQATPVPAPVSEPPTTPAITTAPDQSKMAPEKNWTPSFDCAKASTFSEKAICNDPLLGKLDGALSENYKNMLASDIGDGARADLKESQKKWLIERDKCTNNQCLYDAYRKRINEVCEYPVISGVHPICTSSDEIK